jgi:hypothetical protein
LSDKQIEQVQWDQYLESDLFSDQEKALIDWAHHLTKYSFRQNPEALARMKKHFDHAQIVEATLVSGYFNMWNRFTDSLEIDVEGHDQMTLFTKSVAIDPEDYKAYMRSCWWNGVHLLWTHLGFISDLRKLDIKFT